jgi:hypothetical protein
MQHSLTSSKQQRWHRRWTTCEDQRSSGGVTIFPVHAICFLMDVMLSASSASLLGSALRVGSCLFPLGTPFRRWGRVEFMEQAHGRLSKELHQVGIGIDCVLD